jgi:hypothetical protein
MKNLLMFEDLTWNLSHSIVICHETKPLQETLKHLKNPFLHKSQTWMLKPFNNSKNSLPRTFLNFNFETFNNLKNSLSHTLNLKFET